MKLIECLIHDMRIYITYTSIDLDWSFRKKNIVYMQNKTVVLHGLLNRIDYTFIPYYDTFTAITLLSAHCSAYKANVVLTHDRLRFRLAYMYSINIYILYITYISNPHRTFGIPRIKTDYYSPLLIDSF